MQIRILILLFCCFFCLKFLRAELNLDPRGDQSLNNWSRYGSLRLEIDRTRFSSDEDIAIRIKVKNRGYQTIRIYPYANPRQTFQFFLSDEQGREIPQQFDPEAWEKRERGSAIVDLKKQRVKEIILGPEESFEKILYLNDFYDLEANRNYRLWLYFYPGKNPGQSNFFVRSENLVTFYIDKKRSQKKYHAFPKEVEDLALSPEETVYLFLSAEMQKNWPHYLKYLDLKKYITAYNHYASRYLEAEPRERGFILEQFSTFLISEPAARLKSFRVLDAKPERGRDRTLIEDGRYFVRVMAVREKQAYLKRYEYIYALERQRRAKGFWKIVHVEAKLIP